MPGAPRAAHAVDVPEILRLGEFMYASVGTTVEDGWRTLGASQLAARLDADLHGWVIDDEELAGSLAACGFVNRSPRLPLPGARSGLGGYVQWVVTDTQHQRRGLARKIMGAIFEWSVIEGVDVLELHSSPTARSL